MGFIYDTISPPVLPCCKTPDTPTVSESGQEEREERGIRKPRPLAFSLVGCCQRLAPFVTLVTTPVPGD